MQKRHHETMRTTSSSTGLARLKKVMTPIPAFHMRGAKVIQGVKCFFSNIYSRVLRRNTVADNPPSASTINARHLVNVQGNSEQPILVSAIVPSSELSVITSTNVTKMTSKEILEKSCQDWALSAPVVDKLHIQDELIKVDREKFKELCVLRMDKLRGYLAPQYIAYATNLLFRNPDQEKFKELEQKLKEFDANPTAFIDHMESFEDKLNIFSLRKTLDLHHFNIYKGLNLFDVKKNSFSNLEGLGQSLIKERNLFEAGNSSKTSRIITAFVKPLKVFIQKGEEKGITKHSLERRVVVDCQSKVDDVNNAMNDLKEVANSNNIPLLAFNNLSKVGVCGLLYQEYPECILSLLDVRLAELEADIEKTFSRVMAILPQALGNRKIKAKEFIATLKAHLSTVKTNTPEAFHSFLSQLEKYETIFEKIPFRVALTSKFIDLPGAEKINILEVKSSGGLFNGLVLDEQKSMMQDELILDDAYQSLVEREEHHDRLKYTPLQPVAKHFTKGHVLHFVGENPARARELIMQYIVKYPDLLEKQIEHSIPKPTKKKLQVFFANKENKWAVKALQKELTANHLLGSITSLEPELLCDIIISDCSHQLIKEYKPSVALQMEKIIAIKNKVINHEALSHKQELEEFISDPKNNDLKHNIRLHICTLYLDELAESIGSINPETADQSTLVRAIKTRKLFDDLKGMVGDDPAIENRFAIGSPLEKHYVKLKSLLAWSFIVREQQAKKKTWCLRIPDKQNFMEVISKTNLLPDTEAKLYKATADYVERLTLSLEDPTAVKDDIVSIQRACYDLFSLQQNKVYEDALWVMESKHKQNTDAFLGACSSNSWNTLSMDGDYVEGIELLKVIDKRQKKLVHVKPDKGLLFAPLTSAADIIGAPTTLKEKIVDLEHKNLLLTIGYNYKDELKKNVIKRFVDIPGCLRFWDRSEQPINVLSSSNDSTVSHEQIQAQGEASTSCLERVLGHVETYQKAANCHPKFREMCSNSISLSLISLRLAGLPIPATLETMIHGCSGFLAVSFAAYPKQLTVNEFNAFSEGEKQAFRDIQFLTDSSSMLMLPVLGTCAIKDAVFGRLAGGNLQAGVTSWTIQQIFNLVPADQVQAVYAKVTGLLPVSSSPFAFITGMFGNVSKLNKGKVVLYLASSKKWAATIVASVVFRYKEIVRTWASRHDDGWQPFMLEVGKVLTIAACSLAMVVLSTGITALTSGAVLPLLFMVPQMFLTVWGLCETMGTIEYYGGWLATLNIAQRYLQGTGAVNEGIMKRACLESTKNIMSNLMESSCYKDYEEQEILREYYGVYSAQYYEHKKEQFNNEADFTKWKALHDKAVDTWLHSQRKGISQQEKYLSSNIKAFGFINEELKAFDKDSNNKENVDRINKTLAKLGLQLRANTVNILELLLFFKGEIQSHLALFFNIDELPEESEVIKLLLTQRMKEAYIGGQIKTDALEQSGSSNKFEEKARKHFLKRIESNVVISLDQKIKDLIAHTVFKIFSRSKGESLNSSDARQHVQLQFERAAIDHNNFAAARLSKPDELFSNKCSYATSDDNDNDDNDEFFDAIS